MFTPSYVHVAGIQLIVIGDTDAIYFWISLMSYVHYTEISLRWLETDKISPSGGFMVIYHGRIRKNSPYKQTQVQGFTPQKSNIDTQNCHI